MKAPEFMSDAEIVEAFQSWSETTQKAVLERITGEKSIVGWLETIQSESDWRMIRIYLSLLEEYARELPRRRLKLALDMFYPMLFHPSCTVRSMMAESMGHLLAACQEEMPELWNELLRKILFPDMILEEKQKNWTAYVLRCLLSAVLEKTDEAGKKKIISLYEAYFKSSRWGEQTCINLMSGILGLPHTCFTDLQKHEIFGFMRTLLAGGGEECRTLSLLLLRTWLDAGWKPQDDEKRYMERMAVRPELPYCENYLRRRIRFLLSGKELEEVSLVPEATALLIQKNLHLDNLWVSKVVHLDILKRRFLGLSRSSAEDGDNLFQYATHLLNVLCMNTDAVVFRRAGEDLVEIVPRLADHQKYEIFQEALKEIEMGMDSSNYIPGFLGRTFPYLAKEDRKDILQQLRGMICNRDPELVKTILEVLCEIDAREEEQEKTLSGLLARGLFSYVSEVALEAFFLIGTRKLKENGDPDRMMSLSRKLLTFWTGEREEVSALWPVLVMKHAAEILPKLKPAKEEQPDKIAFFSGTFDPCSEKDIAIIREIRAMGYGVYLYIHEFAWYKNPQPIHIRRHIIQLSIAEMEHVYLFPEDVIINLSNDEDIKNLQELFPGKQIAVVAESEDIEKNDIYWREGAGTGLRHLSHIIFEGNHEFGQMDSLAVRQLIQAESLFLQLPARYRNFTSAGIQERIARGKKISEYVDPQVQSMILEWRLYLDKPIFKKEPFTKPIDRRILSGNEVRELLSRGELSSLKLPEPEKRDTYVAITDGRRGGSICAMASFRETTLNDLFRESDNFELVSAMREKLSGSLLLLTGIYGEADEQEDYRKMVLQELLTFCQAGSASYMLQLTGEDRDSERLGAFGFVPFPGYEYCQVLDMRHSMVLFMNVSSMLREPFQQEPQVLKTIRRCQERLQKAMAKLYPGMLILNFETDILNHQMLQLIREDNGCTADMQPEAMGPKVYVPFGKILKGVRIPNTITKEMNTEKVYDRDLENFEIREFPEYPTMSSQIRNLRSFAKPIVFVDDLYHKGYRIQQIGKLLRKEEMQVGTMICGVASGRGQNLALMEGIDLRAVHTVPNMQAWVLESDMYPFVGGDGIVTDQKEEHHKTSIPSINFILPYVMPSFMQDASAEAVFALSEVCLENVYELFRSLEAVYQHLYHRSLTLDRLSEVMAEPRYPESISRYEQDDRKISEYIEHEKQKLKRLKRIRLL